MTRTGGAFPLAFRELNIDSIFSLCSWTSDRIVRGFPTGSRDSKHRGPSEKDLIATSCKLFECECLYIFCGVSEGIGQKCDSPGDSARDKRSGLANHRLDDRSCYLFNLFPGTFTVNVKHFNLDGMDIFAFETKYEAIPIANMFIGPRHVKHRSSRRIADIVRFV